MFPEADNPNELEELIKSHVHKMQSMDQGSDEYGAAASQLKTLMEARKIIQDTEKSDEEAAKIAAESEKLGQEAENLRTVKAKTEAETAKLVAEASKLSSDTEKVNAETAKLEKEAAKIAAETRQLEDKENHPWRPSTDQLVSAGTTIGTVLIVIAFEMRGVITSKTFGWIPKPK